MSKSRRTPTSPDPISAMPVVTEGCLPGNVELLHADVLRSDLGQLVAGCEAPVRLVANLPYSISAPVLRRLPDLRHTRVAWPVLL